MSKTYNVCWSERRSINVKAKNESEAIEKVMNCEYEEAEVSAELDGSPEAYEVKNL